MFIVSCQYICNNLRDFSNIACPTMLFKLGGVAMHVNSAWNKAVLAWITFKNKGRQLNYKLLIYPEIMLLQVPLPLFFTPSLAAALGPLASKPNLAHWNKGDGAPNLAHWNKGDGAHKWREVGPSAPDWA